MQRVETIAHPNIALIKYWGDRDADLHIPANSSISMNIDGLYTRAAVSVSDEMLEDIVMINGYPATEAARYRISQFLDCFRKLYGVSNYFRIESANNFPSSTGVASSASAFAALSLAVTTVCCLHLDEAELSRLARLGSGSACRSIPGGFVEWQAGIDHESSYAFSIADPSHWDLADCITIVDESPKTVSSLKGHSLANTSPLQTARVAHSEQRLIDCRQAIMTRDFDMLARIVELDSNMMHAVMMTSTPPLIYWRTTTIAVMRSVVEWRKNGLAACYTIDAGANVHVLCESGVLTTIIERLREISGVLNLIKAKVGGAAIINNNN